MSQNSDEEFTKLMKRYYPELESAPFLYQMIRNESPEEQKNWFQVQWTVVHHRTVKERGQIRRLVAKRLTPLLTQNGFVKSNTTFFRIHGDYLLQVISVIFPSTQEPSVEAGIYPLYNIGIDDMEIELSGTRTGTGWESAAIETVMGISNEDEPSYLAYQEDFDEPIEKELELLKDGIIPMFDRIQTADEFLVYESPEGIKGWSSISPLLRAKRYSEAIPILAEFHKMFYENLQNYNKKRLNHPQWPENLYIQKRLDDIGSVLTAIREGMYEKIDDLLDRNIHSAYQILSNYSKSLVKQYPISGSNTWNAIGDNM